MNRFFYVVLLIGYSGLIISPAQAEQTRRIGERYGGGIIFYVDSSGKHGLIAALVDQSDSTEWYNEKYIQTDANADGIGDGANNTKKIIAAQGSGQYAAKIAASYKVQADGVTPCQGASGEVCYNDWYLPSKHELNLLYEEKDVVGGFEFEFYWSSTERDANATWGQNFSDGCQNNYLKISAARVRAVRVF